MTLTKNEESVLNSKSNFKLICGDRKTGKSFACIAEVLSKAKQLKVGTVYYVVPAVVLLESKIAEFKEFLITNRIPYSYVSEKALFLKIKKEFSFEIRFFTPIFYECVFPRGKKDVSLVVMEDVDLYSDRGNRRITGFLKELYRHCNPELLVTMSNIATVSVTVSVDTTGAHSQKPIVKTYTKRTRLTALWEMAEKNPAWETFIFSKKFGETL